VVQDLASSSFHSVTVGLFITFMYLDMVLTLLASLSPRSKEANIFLGSLFKKNIVLFWIVGTTLKTASVYMLMEAYRIIPYTSLLLMCMIGGGGFSVCLMNTLTLISFEKMGRPQLRKTKEGVIRPLVVEPVLRRLVVARACTVACIAPRRVRIPILNGYD